MNQNLASNPPKRRERLIRGIGVALLTATAVVAFSAGCSATTSTATNGSGASTSAAGAATNGADPTIATTGGGEAIDAFCGRLVDQSVELMRRLKTNPTAATDPEFQAYSAKSNAEILAAAPAAVKADITTVFGVSEAVRKAAASGGDVGAAAAASKTPAFKTATTNYFAWVKKSCTADQASQIIGA